MFMSNLYLSVGLEDRKKFNFQIFLFKNITETKKYGFTSSPTSLF